LNADQMADWAVAEGFTDIVPSAWHVTVVRTVGFIDLDQHELAICADRNRQVTVMGDLIALSFGSMALSRRHALHRAAGGTWEHKFYRPHVSFTPRFACDLQSIQPFDGPLMFGPEETAW
jgi:hypothetical protein